MVKKTFTKHDQDKPAMELLPFVAIEKVAEVLSFGAKKYGENNWRRVDRPNRYLGAALRHLVAYGRGEVFDKESGLSHLAHAACCVLFLLEAQECHLGDEGGEG